MKKIICLATIGCLLATFTSSTMAAQNTISTGYIQGDFKGFMNKANGFNIKYRHENDYDTLGWMSSWTYLERDRTENNTYKKGQLFGVNVGPAYRINDWVSIYGMLGINFGKFQTHGDYHEKSKMTDTGFSYGIGVQLNPIGNFAIDLGYEQSKVRSISINSWVASIGFTY